MNEDGEEIVVDVEEEEDEEIEDEDDEDEDEDEDADGGETPAATNEANAGARTVRGRVMLLYSNTGRSITDMAVFSYSHTSTTLPTARRQPSTAAHAGCCDRRRRWTRRGRGRR
jgi:hypothetical protein